jgi:alkanesulfonate monooxygenase SsuD/methylene tetrahydromethanopterin reductase-like flavin-dependent oxidoreductase (luciferase family)
MRFDMRAPEGTDRAGLYAAALDMAAWGDAHGCASLTVSEHHASPDGYLPSPLVLASAMAARTTQVPITVAALLLNFYDPVRVAEDMAVLDALSRGRVVYVIGLGYRPEEYDLFGVDLRTRGRLMDTKLAVLRALLAGETVEYEGRTVRVTPLPLTPGGPFLMYGGHSPAAARRAGRLGLSFLGEASVPGLEEAYLAAAEEAGATPGMCILPPSGGALSLFVSADPDEAWSRYGSYLLHDARMYGEWLGGDHPAANRSHAGSVEELRAERGAYRIVTPEEAVAMVRGGGTLSLHPLCGGLPPDLAWESLHAIEQQVLPALGG